MATCTVTVCDICGTVLDKTTHMRMGPVIVGSTYDGHRNYDDRAQIDLCPQHFRIVDAMLSKVAGDNAHGTTRVFDRDMALAVIILIVRDFGQTLAVPTVEKA